MTNTGRFPAVWLAVALLVAGCQLYPVQPSITPIAQPAEAPESPYFEEEVEFANGDLVLAGTLTLPATSAPHPAMILLTGSGPQDRNNGAPELPDYAPYQQMAALLAQHGIATLRYDDRGVGGSEGDAAATIARELLSDAEAASDYLLQRPEIDAEQVGVLGHSRGGVIAAMLAAEPGRTDPFL